MKHIQDWQAKFITIWCGQAVSILTSSVLQMAIIWHITKQTESATMLSLATLAGFLPQAVLGIFIGTFIDRHSRKWIIMISDLSMALLGLALVMVGSFGQIPIWLIMVVLFLRSVGSTFHQPAFQALIPFLVPKRQLTRCAGYAQGFQAVSLIVSPALAALLFSVWNLNLIILLDVAGAVFAVFMLAITQISETERTKTKLSPRAVVRETWEGVRILKSVPGMFTLLIVEMLYGLIYFPIGTLYPLLTMTYFGGGIQESGLVETVFAGGSLLGALLLALTATRLNKVVGMSLSIGLYGVGVLVTGVLPPDGFYIFVLLSVIMGMAVPFYDGIATAIFQLKIPEQYLGRAFSLATSLTMLSMPIGLVVGGVVSEAIGVENLFLWSGVFTVSLAAAVAILPSMKLFCKEPQHLLDNDV